MAADPYVYPGTDVLRNLLDLRDAAALAEREAALSAIRVAQLERRFIPGDFDLAHLQATHRHIFGDIYPWAGELRTVRITKGSDLARCLSTSIPTSGHCSQTSTTRTVSAA